MMQVLSVVTHYTDDIMILPETHEQAGIDLNTIVTHMTNQGWLMNPAKTRGPAQTAKLLGMGKGTGFFHKGQKINRHYPPRPKQAAQYSVGLSWIVEDAYATPEDTCYIPSIT